MARILAMPQAEALILDFDETLYKNPAYSRQRDESEIWALSRAWGASFEETLVRFEFQRAGLSAGLGRKASRSETVRQMGFSLAWWNQIREQGFQPERYLAPNHALNAKLIQLTSLYRIAVASNSPTPVVERGLRAMGLDAERLCWVVVGTNDAEPKPDSGLYQLAAQKLGVPTSKCLSIGDREDMDGFPAMRLGMGAVMVDSVEDLIDLCEHLLFSAKLSGESFDISQMLKLFKPGEVTFVGFTGQAGAGKTTNADHVHRLGTELQVPTTQLSLDYFFRLSSRERKLWLEEGKQLGQDEYSRRADQMLWWDFDRLEEAINTLRQGNILKLHNVYNRADKGELTLNLEVDPNDGKLVVFEGVAVAHLSHHFSQLVYLHASPGVRKQRLAERDKGRRAVGPEAEERFRLTEAFEQRYFAEHMAKAHMWVDTSGFVPRVMPTSPHLGEC